MLSTTKTYPCAKKSCGPHVQERKINHAQRSTFEKDAVIPLRVSWARNPTAGDTHWSKLCFYINFASLAYHAWQFLLYFTSLKSAGTKLTRVRYKKASWPARKTSIQERKKKKGLLMKNWQLTANLFYNHLFWLIRGCARSPKKLLKEGCRERIAPQWSWIKVCLSAASLTGAGIGGSPYLSAKL